MEERLSELSLWKSVELKFLWLLRQMFAAVSAVLEGASQDVGSSTACGSSLRSVLARWVVVAELPVNLHLVSTDAFGKEAGKRVCPE